MADIKKFILESPAQAEAILEVAGGHDRVARREGVEKKGVTIEPVLRSFSSKAEYRNLIVFQRALLLVDDAREEITRVLLTERSGQETQEGTQVKRITSGPSVLLSHTPDWNLQHIIDLKLAHTGIKITLPDQPSEFFAVRQTETTGAYVFGVNAVRADLLQVLKGKYPDKRISVVFTEDAMERLHAENREMEIGFLRAAMQTQHEE